jgi:hypothetical protein
MFFTSESACEQEFKRFEVILDLLYYARGNGDDIVSLGSTYWEDSVDALESEIEKQGADWPLIQKGVLDEEVDVVFELLDTIREDLH